MRSGRKIEVEKFYPAEDDKQIHIRNHEICTHEVGTIGQLAVIKGNKPLSLRYSRKHRAVLYASEPEYIEAALDDLRGWRELEIPPLTMLTFRHETLKEWQSHPFKFVCQERKGTLPEGVKV